MLNKDSKYEKERKQRKQGRDDRQAVNGLAFMLYKLSVYHSFLSTNLSAWWEWRRTKDE